MLFGLVLVLVEAVSFVAFSVAQGDWFSYVDAARQRASASATVTQEQVAQSPNFTNTRVDPYVGYYLEGHYLDELVAPADEHVLRVLFLGGSVAGNVYFKGGQALVDALGAAPAMAGRPVEVRHATLGGYKQPQQQLLLSYLLTLGARFDVVVNIDGFNEVVLPVTDNAPAGAHPWFPRMWAELDRARDPTRLAQIGELAHLRQQRRSWAGIFTGGWLPYSATCQLVWKIGDRWLVRNLKEREAEHVRVAAKRHQQDDAALERLGFLPGELAQRATELWMRCSIELQGLCDRHGITYLHYLQPNQYVGDKPMGEEERRTAVDPEHRYAAPARAGYLHLRALGPTLQAAGVAFGDLTDLFDDEPRPVYSDQCCHLNDLGCREIVDRIAHDILAR